MITHRIGPDGLKDCFREPIPEIFQAANLLEAAVSAHLLGKAAAAEEAIRAADMPVIGEWIDSVWLGPWAPPYRGIRKVAGLPPVLPKADRHAPRDASPEMKRALVARDGHHCRLCGIPLVRAEVRKKLTLLYPEAARWTGSRASEQHRGLQVMWLQYDHVHVHSRGGETSMENLVVTCPACNFGRDRFTLEEVGLRDPRTHIRKPSSDGWRTWEGLEQLLPEPERFFRGLSIAIDPAQDDAIRNVEQVLCPEEESASARGAEQTDGPENDFFARLNSKRPDVFDRLKAFVSDVEDNGVRPKVGKTLRLLLSANSKIGATAGMLESNGKFWASGAWAAAKRIGRVQAAEQYLQSLAEITGGSVRRYDKSAPEVLDATGRGIDVLVLLNRAADWKQAITKLARDMSA